MTECAPELLDTTLILGDDEDEDQLEIGPDCPDAEALEDGALYFNNLLRPAWALRLDTLPPSLWVKGQVLLSAVEDAAAVVASIIAIGSTQSAVEAQKTLLAIMLAKVDYPLSIVVGDQTYGPWLAWPTLGIQPEPVSPRYAGMLAEQITVSITVNPVGAP